MSKVNSLLTLFAAAGLMGVTLHAQEGYRSEVTVQGLGSFAKETTHDGIRQTTTKSGGILAGYRYYLNQHIGVEMNYASTMNTQNFTGSGGKFGINNRSHEVTGALVYRVPFKRWSVFGLAGAGAIVFDPKDSTGIEYQARAAFVYGGGADYNITHRLFLRGEYRGLIYKSPVYNVANLANNDPITHRAEPSVGVGFRF